MRNTVLLTAVLSALAISNLARAEDAPAEPTSPHTFAYNVGLYSNYIFRGISQTNNELALQGGVDYSHSSGFYLGAWASNISWLTDAAAYKSSSMELDLYGGFASTIGDTGIGYNVGVLQYVYPGSTVSGGTDADTTEVYGSLSYDWIAAKLSVVASSDVFGAKDGSGAWYAEINANYPIADTGITAIAHVGRQDFNGAVGLTDYTDWKLGLSKAWDNGITLGGYYTDTSEPFDVAGHDKLGDSEFTVFVSKTF
jgi:uncharacterized protein (TIGR02001 family)